MIDTGRDQLRRDFAAAAHRLATPPIHAPSAGRVGRRGWRRVPLLAAAAALVAVAMAVVAVGAFRAEPAAAGTFQVVREGRDMIVTVVGDVDVNNPGAAQAELDAAGIDATLVAFPVPPSLVGTIVSLSSPDVRVETQPGTRPRIAGARLVAGVTTPTVVVGYGRPPRPAERYVFTEPPPQCHALVGARVDAARGALDALFPHGIEWHVIGQASAQPTTEPPADGRIVTAMPIAPGRGAVFTVADGPVPDGAGC